MKYEVNLEKLKEFRKKHKLTKLALSEILQKDKPPTYARRYYRIENGEFPMRITELFVLADVYGMTPWDFLKEIVKRKDEENV